MVFGDPTTLETILAAIAAKLVGDSVLVAERVITTLADVEYFEGDPPADQFLAIAPLTFDTIEGQVTGGGANLFGTNGQLSMALWNRFEVDWALSDSDSLTDQTNGILAKWRAILASLQLFAPTDGSGNCILEEPMRLVRWAVRPRRERTPWLVIDSTWEIRFVQNLG